MKISLDEAKFSIGNLSKDEIVMLNDIIRYCRASDIYEEGTDEEADLIDFINDLQDRLETTCMNLCLKL